MYSILNNNLGGVYARKKIAFDTYDDLLIYDTKILKPGSVGIVLDTDTVYVFSTNRTWDKKENEISFDDVPTEGSTNGITSGAVYEAIGNVEATLDAINDGLEGLL